jgi:hypothetical protein
VDQIATIELFVSAEERQKLATLHRELTPERGFSRSVPKITGRVSKFGLW